MKQAIQAYWCAHPNFGDALTPYIIQKLSGCEVALGNPRIPGIKYMCTGSILNWECVDSIVWGCGIANKNDNIPEQHDIRATRGILSAEAANKYGHSVKVWGDPAMLLPRIYAPRKNPEKRFIKNIIGILPHYVDYKAYCEIAPKHVKVINVLNTVEQVIDEICNCDVIVSSSLHGIITAHAYGIPAVYAASIMGIGGDGFKFEDYYATVGREVYHPTVELSNMIQDLPFDTLFKIAQETAPIYDQDMLNKFIESCPFKSLNL